MITAALLALGAGMTAVAISDIARNLGYESSAEPPQAQITHQKPQVLQVSQAPQAQIIYQEPQVNQVHTFDQLRTWINLNQGNAMSAFLSFNSLQSRDKTLQNLCWLIAKISCSSGMQQNDTTKFQCIMTAFANFHCLTASERTSENFKLLLQEIPANIQITQGDREIILRAFSGKDSNGKYCFPDQYGGLSEQNRVYVFEGWEYIKTYDIHTEPYFSLNDFEYWFAHLQIQGAIPAFESLPDTKKTCRLFKMIALKIAEEENCERAVNFIAQYNQGNLELKIGPKSDQTTSMVRLEAFYYIVDKLGASLDFTYRDLRTVLAGCEHQMTHNFSGYEIFKLLMQLIDFTLNQFREIISVLIPGSRIFGLYAPQQDEFNKFIKLCRDNPEMQCLLFNMSRSDLIDLWECMNQEARDQTVVLLCNTQNFSHRSLSFEEKSNQRRRNCRRIIRGISPEFLPEFFNAIQTPEFFNAIEPYGFNFRTLLCTCYEEVLRAYPDNTDVQVLAFESLKILTVQSYSTYSKYSRANHNYEEEFHLWHRMTLEAKRRTASQIYIPDDYMKDSDGFYSETKFLSIMFWVSNSQCKADLFGQMPESCRTHRYWSKLGSDAKVLASDMVEKNSLIKMIVQGIFFFLFITLYFLIENIIENREIDDAREELKRILAEAHPEILPGVNQAPEILPEENQEPVILPELIPGQITLDLRES